MPRTFTDELIRKFAGRLGVPPTREAVALAVEDRYQDYVEAWEIRTGRPWTEMTKLEATELIKRRPALIRNSAVLSRFMQSELLADLESELNDG